MIDYENLLSLDKAIIQADAGCGKTYTIVECLKHITDGKALILTHTHAGVKSIKDKANLLNIKPNIYHVTTIHSFAKQYLQAFYIEEDIPKEEDNTYYNFILEKSKKIFSTKIVKEVLRASYKYLFVDEYQDCTQKQHNIIMFISKCLRTYLFGDPMQGIYSFSNDPSINWESDIPGEFKKFTLKEQYRWKNINEGLGQDIKDIRDKLEKQEIIDLNNYKSINYIQDQNNFFPLREIYTILAQNEHVLLIDANSYNVYHRINFAARYNMRFKVMEAITEKEFYTLSKILDDYEKSRNIENIRKLFETLFKKSIYKYLTDQLDLKTRTKRHSDNVVQNFAKLYQEFINNYTKEKLLQILKIIGILEEIKIYRYELFHDLCKAISTADCNKTTIYQSMCTIRQNKSILGYKPPKKCIGTTLLTKGLEFDVVVLLNAHEFTDPKNFYVAISRACKKLYIVSPTKELSPYTS